MFHPLGEKYGLTKRRILVPPNPVLEKHYRRKTPVEDIVKQTDLEKAEVVSWLRKRRLLDKPSTLDKFAECS